MQKKTIIRVWHEGDWSVGCPGDTLTIDITDTYLNDTDPSILNDFVEEVRGMAENYFDFRTYAEVEVK